MGVSYVAEVKLRRIPDDQSELPPLYYKYSTGRLTGGEVERNYSVSDATTQNVWDPLAVDTEVVGDFDFLFVWSDQTVYIERVVDDGGENGKVVYAEKVVKDLPLMMGADDGYANPSADNAFGGTEDLIERIRIRNDSGSVANVKIILVT